MTEGAKVEQCSGIQNYLYAVINAAAATFAARAAAA